MSHNAYNPETPDAPYADLAECVKGDPARSTEEKEFGISFANPDDRIRVDSAIPSLMKKLLLHPNFDLLTYTTTDGDVSINRSVEHYAEEGHDARKPIYWVSGTLPMGVLKIRPNPRNSTYATDVVTNKVLENE